MTLTNYILASIPLLSPAWIAIDLLENPLTLANWWLENLSSSNTSNSDKPTLWSTNSNDGGILMPSVTSQLLIYSAMGIFGYLLTNRLIPIIKVCVYLYSIKGISNTPKPKGYIMNPLSCCFLLYFLKTESASYLKTKNITIPRTRNALHLYRNIHFGKEYAGKI